MYDKKENRAYARCRSCGTQRSGACPEVTQNFVQQCFESQGEWLWLHFDCTKNEVFCYGFLQ